MRRHLILFALLLLVAPGLVVADSPAAPAEADVSEAIAAEPLQSIEPVEESTLEFLGIGPSKCYHPEPHAGFCDDFDNSFCDYEWDCECCCVAVWAAPGANCGNICV